MSKVKDTVEKTVSTVVDPFDMGYGGKVGSLLTGDLKGALGMDMKMPKMESPQPKPVAPIPDDKSVQLANERRYARSYANAGRAGTVLSGGNLG